MARTREDHSTTVDDVAGAPRLSTLGPLATACAFMAAGIAVIVAAGVMIEVPDRVLYQARLVTRQGEVGLMARRADVIGAIHVSEGQRVAAGDLIVSMETDALLAQRRGLAEDAGRLAERLAAARLDLKDVLAADTSEEATAAAVAVTARRARIADLEGALWSINRQMTALETDVRQASLRAPAAGRVTHIASLGTGMRVERGQVLTTIVPDGASALVEIAVPPEARLAYATARAHPLTQPTGLRLPIPARLIAEGATIGGEVDSGHRQTVMRLEIEDARGELTRSRQAGDVVAHIAFDAGTTKPIINLILAGSSKVGVVAAKP